MQRSKAFILVKNDWLKPGGRGKGGGGGERRSPGTRNDVLTTYKAVTLRGEQRIIAVFFPQKIFLDVRSEPGVCLNVSGRDSRVEVAGAGVGKCRM